MAQAGSCPVSVVHLFKEEKKGIICGWGGILFNFLDCVMFPP